MSKVGLPLMGYTAVQNTDCYLSRGARHGGNLVHSTKKSEEINRNEIRNQEITRKISEFSNQKSLEIA